MPLPISLINTSTAGDSVLAAMQKVNLLIDAVNNEAVIAKYGTFSTAVDALIPGTSSGALLESPVNSHFVIGIRGNDAADGLYVIRGADTANWGTGSNSDYSKLMLGVSRSQFDYMGLVTINGTSGLLTTKNITVNGVITATGSDPGQLGGKILIGNDAYLSDINTAGTIAITTDLAATVFGNLKLSTLISTGNIQLQAASPTIYLIDSDHRSSMIHCNGNGFYVLRGAGVGSSTWATYNGAWPISVNLETNEMSIGGDLTFVGTTLGDINFGSQTRQMINLWGTAFGIGIQSSTWYARTAASSRFCFHLGGVHSDTAADPGAGGTLLATLDGTGLTLASGTWFRTQGSTGWFSQSYGGGIYMTDTTFIRTYSEKVFRVDKTWDGYYGNVFLSGNAPATVYWDTDNAVKWMTMCQSDILYISRCNTQSITAADWVTKFTIDSGGIASCTSIWTTGTSLFGYNTVSNFNASDGSCQLEVRGLAGASAANIAFHRPGQHAAKFGINSANQWEWGGWSQQSATMKLDASGNLMLPAGGSVTVGGNPVGGIKQVIYGSIGYIAVETSVSCPGNYTYGKSVVIINTLYDQGVISIRLNPSDWGKVLASNQSFITIYYQIVEFY